MPLPSQPPPEQRRGGGGEVARDRDPSVLAAGGMGKLNAAVETLNNGISLIRKQQP